MSQFVLTVLDYTNPFTAPVLKGRILDKKTTKSLMDYVVYLPPNYDSSKAYPLLYHFHGAGEILAWVKREVQWTAHQLETAGVEAVVVAPHDSSKFSMFQDGLNIDMETRIQKELIPEVQATYHPTHTFLQGFSMGGFGALAHGFKHAKTMGAKKIVVWDGALHDWDTLTSHRSFIAKGQFGNKKESFDVCSPWSAVELAAQEERLQDIQVLMYTGCLDETIEYGAKFKSLMEAKNGSLTHVETNLRHSFKCFVQSHGQDAIDFLFKP